METIQAISEELVQLGQLQRLLITYESIAALYIRRAKSSVVDSRVFYEGLRGIYDEVLQAYRSEVKALEKKPSIRKRMVQLFSGNQQKQDAAVLLSVNTGLYGDIVHRTLTAFIQHVSSVKTDCIVIGKRGKILFEEFLPDRPYTYIDLPDSTIDVEKILTASQLLSVYQRVHVFYGKFESFISQIPADTVLGIEQQSSLISKLPRSSQTPTVLYLFEPSLREVTKFFETEIFASLFQQLVEESHLAKLASRLFLLDNATGRIRDMLAVTELQKQKVTHQIQNKKQLEVVNSRIAIGV
ncbi:MAG: F0F1 ATP synthase subunit gamma, partial [Patescibacteria group bacterium]